MDLFTIALAAAALFAGKKKKTAERLEYFPKNLELIKGQLVYSMEILNPTKEKLKVDSFFGGIFADDKKIGSVERGTSFDIAPNQRTTVKFPVKLVPAGIAALALNIKKFKSMKFKVAGIARALGLDNEVSQDLSLE